MVISHTRNVFVQPWMGRFVLLYFLILTKYEYKGCLKNIKCKRIVSYKYMLMIQTTADLHCSVSILQHVGTLQILHMYLGTSVFSFVTFLFIYSSLSGQFWTSCCFAVVSRPFPTEESLKDEDIYNNLEDLMEYVGDFLSVGSLCLSVWEQLHLITGALRGSGRPRGVEGVGGGGLGLLKDPTEFHCFCRRKQMSNCERCVPPTWRATDSDGMSNRRSRKQLNRYNIYDSF